MDDPKPRTQEYHEGEEAARRFDNIVQQVIAVPYDKYKKWEEKRKKQRKKAR
ncbi:MAG TPA: hypothetical protein VKK81_28700 [Candidatus Binatia bacterium]|nr:hypothetical protein [Candidatus Binatia bacterium]